jgi:hypothetical protein
MNLRSSWPFRFLLVLIRPGHLRPPFAKLVLPMYVSSQTTLHCTCRLVSAYGLRVTIRHHWTWMFDPVSYSVCSHTGNFGTTL